METTFGKHISWAAGWQIDEQDTTDIFEYREGAAMIRPSITGPGAHDHTHDSSPEPMRIVTVKKSEAANGVHVFGAHKVKLYLVAGAQSATHDDLREAVGRVVCASWPDDACVGYAIVVATTDGADVFCGGWQPGDETRFIDCEERVGFSNAPLKEVRSLVAAIRAFEIDAFLSVIAGAADWREAESAYVSKWFAEHEVLPPREVMRDTFARFSQAWSQGDIDGLMECMAAQPVYSSSGGTRHVGREAVREAFTAICKPSDPSVEASPPEAHFFGNRSLSYWTLPLPAPDGRPSEVSGVDIVTYDGAGRIMRKDAYRKLK